MGKEHAAELLKSSYDFVADSVGEGFLVHIIAYDLKSPNDTESDYKRVIEGLKSDYTTWCHLEKSVWLVETEQSAADIRDTMKKLLNDSDVFFVARLQKSWASTNLGAKRVDWLKARTF